MSSEEIRVVIADDDDVAAAAERRAAEFNRIAQQKNREAEAYQRQAAQQELQKNRNIINGAIQAANQQKRAAYASGDIDSILEADQLAKFPTRQSQRR